MINRAQYKNARLLLNHNGASALRWLPARVAGVFKALRAQRPDALAEKAAFLASYKNAPADTGARWNLHAHKGAK